MNSNFSDIQAFKERLDTETSNTVQSFRDQLKEKKIVSEQSLFEIQYNADSCRFTFYGFFIEETTLGDKQGIIAISSIQPTFVTWSFSADSDIEKINKEQRQPWTIQCNWPEFAESKISVGTKTFLSYECISSIRLVHPLILAFLLNKLFGKFE